MRTYEENNTTVSLDRKMVNKLKIVAAKKNMKLKGLIEQIINASKII